MNTTNHSVNMIKDIITDALSDESLSAEDIASVIRDELNEWVKYHRTQMNKAEKVLGLLDPVHDMSKFDKFDLFGDTFGDTNSLGEDIYSPSDLIYRYRPTSTLNDTIKF